MPRGWLETGDRAPPDRLRPAPAFLTACVGEPADLDKTATDSKGLPQSLWARGKRADWLGLRARLPSYDRCEMRPRPVKCIFRRYPKIPKHCRFWQVASFRHVSGRTLREHPNALAKQAPGSLHWRRREALEASVTQRAGQGILPEIVDRLQISYEPWDPDEDRH